MDSSVTVPQTKLIVGLGNPDSKYVHTRHNMGFSMVDATVQSAVSASLADWQPKDGILLKCRFSNGSQVYLLKPMTYMNDSGRAVGETIGTLGFSPQEILVISDDLDRPLGKLRLRLQGTAGGHRGILSIAQVLGTEDFPRLRIGIGRPQSLQQDIVQYVLGEWTSDDDTALQKISDLTIRILEECASQGPVPQSWNAWAESDKGVDDDSANHAESKEKNVEKV